MTNFTPDGTLIVAFENGEVKMWQASVNPDALKDNRRDRQSRIKSALGYDVADIPNVQFDLKDTFDMHDPSGEHAHVKQLGQNFDEKTEEQQIAITSLT